MNPLRLLLLLALATPAICADPKPAPASAPAGKPIVLFDGSSLDDWEARDAGGSGSVEIKDKDMIIGAGDSITGVVYKKAKDLPVTNYEITLDAQRLDGVDFFCGLTFPVGSPKTCATLVLGGWGGSVTGISSIDGMDASENSTGHYRKFDNNKWYAVKLRVTPANISAWVGEEKVIDVDIEGKRIGVRAGPIEDYQPLSLTTYATMAGIRNIKLTPLAAEAPKVEKK
ncbi:hypothetical protein DES53_11343 [Roseimicrobium gellanilyticum]|uniref:3-keto-alpha-glucoside-1,2-lyase/3-keto-2-hydroxy-glucal hydratase domain-containing protein n=1 Tax=Roseimicrobium gellanilyticum TaxID=748857 RepID=A0A366H8G7_9BACT|nr:family 16 glycoside hydrolase [Roseimicrobium gellanilyticum]RBP37661.1 hypothetical protein DES53_11343 [Roseimicrobium gellanilyticum]